MNRGYIVIDGSGLFAAINDVWRQEPKYAKKKINLNNLTASLQRKWSINLGSIIRIVYYFKKQDTRLKEMLIIPKSNEPGAKNHWYINECGEGVKTIPDTELQKLDPKYRDTYARAEKALDTKLTCDVLTMVATNKANNFAFFVNDRDYIPLFEAIHNLGGNVYLTALNKASGPSEKLTDFCDSYLTLEDDFDKLFDENENNDSEPKLQQVGSASPQLN